MAEKSSKRKTKKIEHKTAIVNYWTAVIVFVTAIIGLGISLPTIKGCSNSSSFPTTWNGSFEGLTADENPSYESMRLIITDVSPTGNISAICEIGFDESKSGEGFSGYYIEGSYQVEGSINWATGDIEMQFYKWRYQGELENKRRFKGKYSKENQTIEGSTYLLEGKTPHPWSMSAD